MEKTKYYSYFFTRQDLSAEQQLVQTAHAALKMGYYANYARKAPEEGEVYIPHKSSDINPDETYFTCVGVRNLDALEGVRMILDKFGYGYEVFVEPDIGDEMTSIALYPVAEYNRGPLLAFNLLKMAKN